MILSTILAAIVAAQAPATDTTGRTIPVKDVSGLRRALAGARPGDRIKLAPGTYEGGVGASGLKGTAARPIVIEAADRARPPVFRGGVSALQLSGVEHVHLIDLVCEGATGNGINIDDGGRIDRPTRGVVLTRLKVTDVGPSGNRDGIKLSGVDEFRVEDCVIERWGSQGSGIDMVGCHKGEIVGCTFKHGDRDGDSGVQAKGGSSEVAIKHCRFEHAGQRAVNLGGSTGLSFFRPKSPGYEAKNLTVEDCIFVGSFAPVAFVGVDGSTVRRNTFYRPAKWLFRILQETRDPGFVPSRNGVFEENLVVFRSNEISEMVNVGPGTSPDSFSIARNAWYCLDSPARSRPRLPVKEEGGRYGVAPAFKNPEAGDFTLAGPGAQGARPRGAR